MSEPTCPWCGSDDKAMPNLVGLGATLCRATWHATPASAADAPRVLPTEGAHPNGPIEGCPCHLCRYAFGEDSHSDCVDAMREALQGWARFCMKWPAKECDDGSGYYSEADHDQAACYAETLRVLAAPILAYNALAAKVARLEAALRFYADRVNYVTQHLSHDGECCGGGDESEMAIDRGSKARAALEEPCKGDSPEAAEEDKP